MVSRFGRNEPVTEDYGLLFPIATVSSEQAAHCVREVLRARGIRSTTTAPRAVGGTVRIRVLVFPEDAARAFNVICAHTTQD
ncbi:hypothetical protein [Nocardia cyriacigeorgica]|uniref:DUF2007 domain-containing protein n=1 Tax=Nocardia cyriacigeorgica TaxID=135487 RepID=A0A5R8NY01_9NOCA|nr:hypothetical protein [Nocardia cyriacigeorgica]TLF81194.1 hypothetical protein FEK34_06000 [Nocardia cyriacigeorgica]